MITKIIIRICKGLVTNGNSIRFNLFMTWIIKIAIMVNWQYLHAVLFFDTYQNESYMQFEVFRSRKSRKCPGKSCRAKCVFVCVYLTNVRRAEIM